MVGPRGACIWFYSWVELFCLVTLVLVGWDTVAVDHGAWKMEWVALKHRLFTLWISWSCAEMVAWARELWIDSLVFGWMRFYGWWTVAMDWCLDWWTDRFSITSVGHHWNSGRHTSCTLATCAAPSRCFCWNPVRPLGRSFHSSSRFMVCEMMWRMSMKSPCCGFCQIYPDIPRYTQIYPDILFRCRNQNSHDFRRSTWKPRPYHTARIYIFGENVPRDPWRLSLQVPEELRQYIDERRRMPQEALVILGDFVVTKLEVFWRGIQAGWFISWKILNWWKIRVHLV